MRKKEGENAKKEESLLCHVLVFFPRPFTNTFSRDIYLELEKVLPQRMRAPCWISEEMSQVPPRWKVRKRWIEIEREMTTVDKKWFIHPKNQVWREPSLLFSRDRSIGTRKVWILWGGKGLHSSIPSTRNDRSMFKILHKRFLVSGRIKLALALNAPN